MLLSVSEIVSSLQGEGKYTGYPTTFVRLFGCNLKCGFCDAQYASNGRRKRMSIDTILNYIFKMANNHVCITGGEPLLQENVYCLVYELVDKGIKVSIETNGAVKIDETPVRSYNYCMDIKCPSSKMEKKNIYSNLVNLMSNDEVKFVISDIEDYEFAKAVLRKYDTQAKIIFSPCFDKDGKHNGRELSQWLLEDKLPNARLGMQTHKLLGIY
jgi:7-carboxy-7-deazaguanine synthase